MHFRTKRLIFEKFPPPILLLHPRLQNHLSSQWPTCRSSLHTSRTSWYTWHIHLSNIWLLERKFVKSSTLLRLKTHFLSRLNPRKFDPKFQETRFPMRYDISIFLQLRGDQVRAHKCSLFLFPVHTSQHCWNKLFPVPVSVISTGNPVIALFFLNFEFAQLTPRFLVFGLLCRHTASDSITSETHTNGAQ